MKITEPPLGRRGTLTVLTTIAALSVTLSACVTDMRKYREPVVGAVPEDYRDTHPITITESIATFDIPVGTETTFLPRGWDANLLGFASNFLQSGSSVIAIVLPTRSRNAAAAAAIAVEVEGILLAAGVVPAAIEYRTYQAGAQETIAPIRLAYVRLGAETAGCGPWTDNVARNYSNTHYGAFGCAAQQNLAAMVSNPLDLLYPRMMTPPSAARRGGVLSAYQNGQPTATQFPVGAGVTP